MKSEDFERLKVVCEKEGFEIGFKYDESTYTIRLKKDIWEGVEFVEFTDIDYCDQFTNGKIYKVDRVLGNRLNVCSDNSGSQNGWRKIYFKPSTESAYIEQLKAETFKRFGEIKEGDRFIEPNGNYYNPSLLGGNWFYIKDFDQLKIADLCIYQQGKWATRVPKRVKVDPDSAISITDAINQCFRKDSKEFSKFLSEKLEEYLNK